MKPKIIQAIIAAFLCGAANAQVNSGSNGSDGALDYSSLTNLGYSTNIVINMADHPNGIYQYTYVTIPNNVTVMFIPNANNSPVTWLVQNNVVINGTIDVSGQSANGAVGGIGGPGGWTGGSGGSNPTAGQGPGGGAAGGYAFCGSYGTLATSPSTGTIYGNQFILPLLGGSGGGGTLYYSGFGVAGGGGGGGAILIAASGQIQVNGIINAAGGYGVYIYWGGIGGGSGSGGAVRLVATKITGAGNIAANGQVAGNGYYSSGSGRVRFDTFESDFAGTISGVSSQGFQPIIISTPGQGAQLTVTSVGGVAVSASPTGTLSTPDAVLSAQQNNPIPVTVSCANIPLNTQITVSVRPANGAAVTATGYNTTGTLAASTATISIVMPRGGGLIYATAVTSN
jgi:hypothetical protein